MTEQKYEIGDHVLIEGVVAERQYTGDGTFGYKVVTPFPRGAVDRAAGGCVYNYQGKALRPASPVPEPGQFAVGDVVEFGSQPWVGIVTKYIPPVHDRYQIETENGHATVWRAGEIRPIADDDPRSQATLFAHLRRRLEREGHVPASPFTAGEIVGETIDGRIGIVIREDGANDRCYVEWANGNRRTVQNHHLRHLEPSDPRVIAFLKESVHRDLVRQGVLRYFDHAQGRQ